MPDTIPSKIQEPLDVNSNVIVVKFDWKTVIRIGLVWAAEYAMLALIEDSPEILKVATLVCAVAGLAIMQFEQKIRNYDRRVFLGLIVAVAVTYLSFGAYAVWHGLERESAHANLRSIYTAGDALVGRPILKPPSGGDLLSQSDVDQFQIDIIDWEKKSSDWLEKNFSPAARARFLDPSGMGTICWTTFCQQPYNGVRNRLINEMRNLAAIMESPVYEK